MDTPSSVEEVPAEPEKHLTPEALAEREGVELATVYQWNSRGGGPPYMKIGRLVRYKLADVVAWENSQRREVAS